MRTFRPIPYEKQQEYIRKGWRITGPMPGPHGKYSVRAEKLYWWERLWRWLR